MGRIKIETVGDVGCYITINGVVFYVENSSAALTARCWYERETGTDAEGLGNMCLEPVVPRREIGCTGCGAGQFHKKTGLCDVCHKHIADKWANEGQ